MNLLMEGSGDGWVFADWVFFLIQSCFDWLLCALTLSRYKKGSRGQHSHPHFRRIYTFNEMLQPVDFLGASEMVNPSEFAGVKVTWRLR